MSDPFSRLLARRQRDALDALQLKLEDRLLDVGWGTGAGAVAKAAPNHLLREARGARSRSHSFNARHNASQRV